MELSLTWRMITHQKRAGREISLRVRTGTTEGLDFLLITNLIVQSTITYLPHLR